MGTGSNPVAYNSLHNVADSDSSPSDHRLCTPCNPSSFSSAQNGIKHCSGARLT
jgi:hypothetical protein